VKDFRELKVWEKAHQLTLHAYRITDTSQGMNYLDWQVKYGDAVPQFPQTSPKAVVAWAILNCIVSCKSLVDLLVSWNITSSLLGIWATCHMQTT
jgi:hypothetical protein